MNEAKEPPYVEVEDLVRLRGSGRLAFVQRVSGDSSDDEDSLHGHNDVSDDDSLTDERGRLTRWVDGVPGVSSLADQRRRDADGRHLISSYDDEDGADDEDEPDELPDVDRNHDDHPPANGTSQKDLPDGYVLLLIAATGDKIVHPTKDLEPLDRNFDPGQLISWAPGRGPHASDPASQQSGILEAVRKTVIVRRIRDITPSTAEIPDPDTCFEVPSDRLGFFSGIRAGDTVVRGKWVGIIDYFEEDVFVRFSDGSIACLPGHRKALQNVDQRTPDRARPDPFSEGLYYPGQLVRSLPEVWKTIAVWIRGSYSGEDEGIVNVVQTGDVGVEWAAKSMYADADEDNPPTDLHERGVEVVRFSDITLLEGFRNLWWSVGDRGFLLDSNATDKPRMLDNVAGPEEMQLDPLPTVATAVDDEDSEWEEYIPDDQNGAGPSSMTEVPPRLANKTRAKRVGGRLMKAQRKARERGGGSSQVGTVTDAALANLSAIADDVVQVVGTRSRVDVLWQDGTRSKDALSLNFRINSHPDPYDFWPGEIVVKTDDEFADKDNDETNGKTPAFCDKRKGALVRVNQNDRTAIVKWEKNPASGFEEEEEVSVYELKTDEYDVGIGDTVLHVPNNSPPEQRIKEWVGVITKQTMGECTVAWYGGNVSNVPTRALLYISGGDDDTFETGLSTTDVDSEPANAGISGGLRMGLPARAAVNHVPHDPEYHPNWGTDEEGEVGLEQSGRNAYGKSVIAGLLMATDIDRFRHDIDMGEVTASLETVVMKRTEELKAKRHKADGSIRRRRISKTEERRVAASMTFHLLEDLLSRSVSKFYEQNGKQARQFPAPYHDWEVFINTVQEAYGDMMKRETDWLAEQGPLHRDRLDGEIERLSAKGGPGVEIADDVIVNGSREVGVEKGNNAVSYNSDEDGLQKFQMVEELKDFHSFSNIASGATYSAGFLSVIHKEWNRLGKNLPPGVIVRACESKLDKLRAGVVGPQDTPYADVIFFFDIRLGPTYPMAPPHVWFHSQGRRINPNLYDDGKVCLSILGTWDGDDVESWDAKTSNLLRLLLSLQALVFVEEPYYNEAGYSKQRGTHEGRVNSRMYNESAYLLCMRYVLQTLRSGGVPEDCAQVAVAHYRSAGPRILERCRRLSQGDVVMLTDAEDNSVDAHGGGEDQRPYSSTGFRKSLSQLLKPLENAMSVAGGLSSS